MPMLKNILKLPLQLTQYATCTLCAETDVNKPVSNEMETRRTK